MRCCYNDCRNNNLKKSDKSFFRYVRTLDHSESIIHIFLHIRLPKHPELRQIWLNIIRPTRPLSAINRVCSAHFRARDIRICGGSPRLSKTAIPFRCQSVQNANPINEPNPARERSNPACERSNPERVQPDPVHEFSEKRVCRFCDSNVPADCTDLWMQNNEAHSKRRLVLKHFGIDVSNLDSEYG